MDSDDQGQQIRWENSDAISFPNWVFRCRRSAIPQERRTAFRSEGEQQSERSDADLMIVQEGFASSMLKKACIAGFIRWWIAFFTHGLSAHLDAMGVVLIFRGTPNGDGRAPALSKRLPCVSQLSPRNSTGASACEKKRLSALTRKNYIVDSY
jgi:hypothetical protein